MDQIINRCAAVIALTLGFRNRVNVSQATGDYFEKPLVKRMTTSQ